MKIKITKEKIILASVKITVFMVYLLLSSCKSTKSTCDAYGSNHKIKQDSIILNVEHCHIEDEKYCFYNIDTIHLTK